MMDLAVVPDPAGGRNGVRGMTCAQAGSRPRNSTVVTPQLGAGCPGTHENWT